jgi:predicted transglutaminase-like cysteine proteinase
MPLYRLYRPLLAVLLGAAGPALIGAAHGQTVRMEAIPSALQYRNNEPFHRWTVTAPIGPLWIKWRALEDGLTSDTEAISRCRSEPLSCPAPVARFVSIVDEARATQGRRRLGLVNRAINLAIRYVSDLSQHGVPDLWSSPLSSMTSGQGDCEDYAIAKYLALREAGVPASDLRLLLGHSKAGSDMHAVLAAREDGRWIILDNRHMALVEDRDVPDLLPLVVLDDGGVRKFAQPLMDVADATTIRNSTDAPMHARDSRSPHVPSDRLIADAR